MVSNQPPKPLLKRGATQRRIANGKDPSWSPDGRHIAYVTESKRNGVVTEEVWLVDPLDGSSRRLVAGGYPSWSADGKTLYVRSRKRSAILAVDVDAEKPEPRVFYEGRLSFYPTVSPDGKYIASREGNHLVILDSRTGKKAAISNMGDTTGLLSEWSSSGHSLAFGSHGNDGFGVWIFDLRGKTVQLILEGDYAAPAWSKDQKRLAVDWRGGPWEIWTVDLEVLRQLKELRKDDQDEYLTSDVVLARTGQPLVAGNNVIMVEVHQANPRSSDLCFDLELIALRQEGESTTLVRRGSVWRYNDRGEDLNNEWLKPSYEDATWSIGETPMGYGGETIKSTRLTKNLDALKDKITALELEITRERLTWKSENTETQWRHDILAELVNGLETFCDSDPRKGQISGVRERLEFARSVREKTVEGEAARLKWAEAIVSIADETACPSYKGLKLTPQTGLIPLGRDPDSGLWEFAHLQTGIPPERDANGKLLLMEETSTSLVFVLVPGGTFWMGAQKNDSAQPNYDPQARRSEEPVHRVRLEPYFLSKYEMTQGQWLRCTGNNPSLIAPGDKWPGSSIVHPVEQVNWGLVPCESFLESGRRQHRMMLGTTWVTKQARKSSPG